MVRGMLATLGKEDVYTLHKDINTFSDKCQNCAEYKGLVSEPAPIKTYPMPQKPWETVEIKLLKLP